VVFAHYLNPLIAAGLGALFVIGRWVYFVGYVKDPKQRSLGFMLSFIPNMILLLGAVVGAAISLVRYGFA
jgi:glutathione S-transferase